MSHQKSGLTLNEGVSNAPSFVKPLALFTCNECPFANTTIGALQAHKKKEHETELLDVQPVALQQPKPVPTLMCEECVFSSETRDELLNHIKDVHVVNPDTINNVDEGIPKPDVKILPLYKCDVCTFMTRTEENLNVHGTTKHNKDKPEIVKVQEKLVLMHSCISCEFKTNDYEELRNHVDADHKPIWKEQLNILEVYCEVCGEAFHDIVELENHKENLHTANAASVI